MSHRIQFRRDTKSRWAEINPVLMEGELGLEVDTQNIKMGDGTNAWNDLEYGVGYSNVTNDPGDNENLVISQKGVTELIKGIKAGITAREYPVIRVSDFNTGVTESGDERKAKVLSNMNSWLNAVVFSTDNAYIGHCLLSADGRNCDVYNYVFNYSAQKGVQVLSGGFGIETDGTIAYYDGYKTLYRVCNGGTWGKWNDEIESMLYSYTIADTATTLQEAFSKIPTNYKKSGLLLNILEKETSTSEARINTYIYVGQNWLTTFNSYYWVKLAKEEKKILLATSGNSQGTYVIGNVGETVKIFQGSSSVNCTNLIDICNIGSYSITLNGLFSGNNAASYMVLDKSLIILSSVFNKTSVIITKDYLPKNARYIVANSSSITTNVMNGDYNSPLYKYDSGISIITALKILETSGNLDSMQENLDSIGEETNVTTRLTNISCTDAVVNKFFIGRLINSLGGTVSSVHFDNDIIAGTYKIAVLLANTSNKYTIKSLTDVTIDGSSKDIDLSSYNISVPSGKTMVSFVINEINGEAKDSGILYNSNKVTDTYENKCIGAFTKNVSVGETFNLNSSFNFICCSTYFTLKVSKIEIDGIKNDIQEIKEEIQQLKDNRFKDKNVVIFGDSITWYGGDDLTGDRGWTKYFNQHFTFNSIKSYARSGATLTATSDTIYDIVENTGVISANNVLYNQVNRMIDAINKGTQNVPDYIFVALGTNDYSRGLDTTNDEITVADDLGTDYSTNVNINTCTTFIKAMRFFHDQIWNVNKDAQIIILTPLQRGSSLQAMYKCAQQIKRVAYFLSWPVIDQFGCSMLSSISESLGHAKDTSSWDYTPDGLHPSARGAKFIGDWIAQQAKTFMRI